MGSVQERHMYRFRCDFSSCSESTEICHANSFLVKNVPVSSSRQKNMDKPRWKSPPPPVSPSPNDVGFRCLKNEQCVGGGGGNRGGGGGVDFHARVWSLVFPLVEKNVWDIFPRKKSLHAWFQWILRNLKNRDETHTWAFLAWSPSIAIN